jgi:hypothetical protein
MKIHFVVASEQVMQNIVPIMMDPPDEVHIAVSEQMKSSLSLENLKRFIKKKVLCKYLIKPDFPSSIVEVSDWVRQYLRSPELQDAELTVNLTGGTKQMALGIYRALSQLAPNTHAIYVDTLSRHVESVPLDNIILSKMEEDIPERLLSTQLQFYAYGHYVSPSNTSYDDSISNRKVLTKNLLEESYRSGYNLIKAINSFAGGRGSRRISPSNYTSWSLTFSKDDIDKGRWSDLLDKIVTAGLVDCEAEDGALRKYVPKSYEAYLYLTGGWLEEYCYTAFSLLPEFEVMHNIEIRSIKDNTVTNELDVVIGYHNRMAIIECKASATEGIINDAMYKLNGLSRVLGGTLAAKVLVCPLIIPSGQRSSEHGIVTISDRDDMFHLGDRLKKLL